MTHTELYQLIRDLQKFNEEYNISINDIAEKIANIAELEENNDAKNLGD